MSTLMTLGAVTGKICLSQHKKNEISVKLSSKVKQYPATPKDMQHFAAASVLEILAKLKHNSNPLFFYSSFIC